MPPEKGPKSLEKDRSYEPYDLDHDGVVSDSEIAAVNAIHAAATEDEKADAQRRMAWAAMISMMVFTSAVFLPIIPDTRIHALSDLLGLFYIGQAGVVGAYMGMTAYMSTRR